MEPAHTQDPTQTAPDRRVPRTLPTAPLAAGQKAPDVELRTTPDPRIALSSCIGQPIVEALEALDPRTGARQGRAHA